MQLLVSFYSNLINQWYSEAIQNGVDINTHLRNKGKNGILMDMKKMSNIKQSDFCQCFQQIYKMLNNQPSAAISAILGLVIPGLPIAKDILDIIVGSALDYCGFTSQGNKLALVGIIGLALVAALALIGLAIKRR